MQTKSLSLYHIIRPSSIEKNAPVLFMLHGYGSNEEDLFSFAAELPEDYFIISVRAPYPLQPSGNAWYAINFDAEKGKWSDDEQAIESRDKIASFITEACAAYSVDQNNVTLLGFSQGTILSYAVALSYPEKVSRVIALSGYINENIIKEGYEKNDFSSLKIYASHGSVDQVIPVDWAAKAPKFLDHLGITNTYEEFPVGHGVAPQNFYSFKTWLAQN
ncbi:phospholipase/Carboxylesterase [Cellulophaga algicola DSM 14237]|uniref:Phospholipase/Carboxylesterase n=1 Tax=Cellulophaga algicola (strain DSM 14237 / IC166 / ACAM 630) TaxID=688270 RepID=E6X7L8_CELAD|nr:alpha/beta fold hydrolase [Cellulophaga algicola]ADV50728.1 phospholipase/Carboxylesterase [Cellulophaga algicola DSM 14237]